jgi:hypothetical protein
MRTTHVTTSIRYPTQAEIEAVIRDAHRARAEAVHGYLIRAGHWLARLFMPRVAARKPRVASRATMQGC